MAFRLVVAALAAGYWAWWFFPSASRLHLEDRVADILEQATSWELLSLTARHPVAMQERIDALEKGDPMPDGLFRWRTVLGRATVTDDATRRTLTRSFNRACRGWNHWSVFCWGPRHAIRASLTTGESVDLLISFECLKYRAYSRSGERIAEGTFGNGSSVVFDRAYRSLGLVVEEP